MHWHFDSAPARGATVARAEFVAFLQARCTTDSDLWASELIFGELVGNALRHATVPIDVYLHWTERHNVKVDVRDCGEPFRYTPRLPEDTYKENGRGLFIVTTLALEFHIIRDADDCTVVSAVLPATMDLLKQ